MKIPPTEITGSAVAVQSVKKIKKAPKKQPNSTNKLVTVGKKAMTTLNVSQDEAHAFSDGEDDANKRKYDTISD